MVRERGRDGKSRKRKRKGNKIEEKEKKRIRKGDDGGRLCSFDFAYVSLVNARVRLQR